MIEQDTIVFYDGKCNLCNKSINFLIKRDKNKRLKYASLQGETAKKLLSQKYINDLSTVVLYNKGIIYTKSTAAIHCLTYLNEIWPIARVLLIIPKFIRDYFYSIIAKRRIKYWGQTQSCRIPTKQEANLFLD